MIPGITLPSDWLRMGLRAAPYFLIAALAIGLVLTRGKLATEKANTKALVAMIEARTAEAEASDRAHAADVAATYSKVRDEVSHDLETKLASARADAARYAARLRAQAAQSGGIAKDMPFTPATPGAPAGAGETTELDDLDTCSVNTVKAAGWQAWWAKVEQADAR